MNNNTDQNRHFERKEAFDILDLPDEEELDTEESFRQQRRRRIRANRKKQREHAVKIQRVLLAVVSILLILVLAAGTHLVRRAWARSTLSEAVLGYQDVIEKYAEQEGIEDYVDVLLAIMMVESEGGGGDVMQSSESKGLDRNSLDPEESIEQACIYFAALMKIADELDIHDDKALIQAYNFGPGYLEYLAEHGKKHRQKLAIAYAKKKSKGEKMTYLNLYAIKKNGGWIYKFGNMFYDALVQQYL